ncbi:hypothetical protein FXO38_19897 [Capsicum annuum]|nr:hypothetical protein FXO38_19897 [Capsicum annuum]
MGNKQISMNSLSIDVSWSLFKRHAFKTTNPMGHSELEEVRKQIAAKCKGLPLALKTLAGMLRSKSEEDETIQDSGNQYFLELRSRSLFEKVPNPSQGNTEKFLMHDHVNDLAQIASSKLCISKRVLHIILPTLGSLRSLSLSHYEIKELPDDLFVKLKLLRFLDLYGTTIKMLPNSICVLYNLETLLLSSCNDIEELPLQMEKLINLRHLDIRNNSRLKIPLHLSKLKSLQVLVGAKFLLGCLRMEDLREAHNLHGSLSILEL